MVRAPLLRALAIALVATSPALAQLPSPPGTGPRGTRATTDTTSSADSARPVAPAPTGAASTPAPIAPMPVRTATATGLASSEQLKPGDVVRLRIWREPDLSGDYAVADDGGVVFPLVGRRIVGTESAASLRQQLIESYRVYLRNPSIDVTILRRVNVMGAVRTPGLYPVDGTLTIADVVALAGGATPLGATDRVVLLREGKQVGTVRLTSHTRLSELPLQSGDQLMVPERSWISRNAGVLATVLSATASLAIALFLRH